MSQVHLVLSESSSFAPSAGDGVCVFKFSIGPETECCRVGTQSFLITLGCVSVLLCFRTRTEFNAFHTMLSTQSSLDKEQSAFDQRTDVSSARQYFQVNIVQPWRQAWIDEACTPSTQGKMRNEQRPVVLLKALTRSAGSWRISMEKPTRRSRCAAAMEGRVRSTDTLGLPFQVVLDVGCGSGILSFFAIQAGARKVYAVEASSVAKYTQMLVKSNHLSDRITVLAGKIEEVSFPERVDIIVSEPIGYMLLNERMLESYLHSKKWLKPRGMMFPTFSDLHLAPFTDEQLYMEHYARSSFWHQTSFFGIDLSSLHSAAVDEFFKQPIVDTFDKQILMAKSIKFSINFLEAKEEDLHRMEIPFVFQLLQSGLIHGLAVWFDVAFVGSRTTVWLSTSPSEPLTHWYQVRCLLQTPLFAKAGQTLSGTVLLVANKRQSYDIHLSAVVDQSGFKSGNTLDLKNPFFR
uniref:type I protein arginine methyltransferase n=1 Tax=Scleropages formosus TaxID=113540 RepID=A0A8C9SX88_SCLFO